MLDRLGGLRMRKEKQKRTNFCPECGGEAYIIDTRPSAKHKGLTRYEDASGYSRTHIESLRTNESIKCRECANEHRQLAEWLKALKEIWDSGDCNDCRNGQCEWKPRLGQLVRFNCPHYVGVANKEVNADE